MSTKHGDTEKSRRNTKPKNLEDEIDQFIEEIGRLEDQQEKILGKESAELFWRTGRLDPAWDKETKEKISRIQGEIDRLSGRIDRIEATVRFSPSRGGDGRDI